jgi:single-stranded DNA-binding protein
MTNINMTVIGTLTNDPDMRVTRNGHDVATFTLQGDIPEGTSHTPVLLPCTAWSNQATNITNSLRAGDRVIAYGKLAVRQAPDGMPKQFLDIIEVGPSLKAHEVWLEVDNT